MFLTIIRGSKDHTYHCDYVLTEGSDSTLTVEIGKYGVHGAVRTFEIDKAERCNVGVYGMNDAGKTVTTFFQKHES